MVNVTAPFSVYTTSVICDCLLQNILDHVYTWISTLVIRWLQINSVETQSTHFVKCFFFVCFFFLHTMKDSGVQNNLDPIDFLCMDRNSFSKYLFVSYRFETTYGRISKDRIFHDPFKTRRKHSHRRSILDLSRVWRSVLRANWDSWTGSVCVCVCRRSCCNLLVFTL